MKSDKDEQANCVVLMEAVGCGAMSDYKGHLPFCPPLAVCELHRLLGLVPA